MAESILIVGAGANQVAIVAKAQELGLTVVAVDGDSSAPAFAGADHHEVADILDPDALVTIARRYGVQGVYPAAELAVEASALTIAELDLPGIAPDTAARSRNKLLMREALDRAGMPNPSYAGVTTLEEADEASKTIGFPLIVKPPDANASKGVQRIDGAEELAGAFENAQTHSHSKVVLLEAYLDGEEFCVDGLMFDGVYRLGGITGKFRSQGTRRFDEAIFMPGSQDEDACKVLETCSREALEAIGCTTGITHVEIILTDRSPYVVEIACRPGGGRIPTDLIPMAYGMDITADSLRAALGRSPEERRRHERGVALFWIPAEPGTVQRLEGFDDARRLPGVVEVVEEAQPGDRLDAIVDCVTRDRVGYVLTKGETAQEAIDAARRALETCRVVTA